MRPEGGRFPFLALSPWVLVPCPFRSIDLTILADALAVHDVLVTTFVSLFRAVGGDILLLFVFLFWTPVAQLCSTYPHISLPSSAIRNATG